MRICSLRSPLGFVVCSLRSHTGDFADPIYWRKLHKIILLLYKLYWRTDQPTNQQGTNKQRYTGTRTRHHAWYRPGGSVIPVPWYRYRYRYYTGTGTSILAGVHYYTRKTRIGGQSPKLRPWSFFCIKNDPFRFHGGGGVKTIHVWFSRGGV